MNRRVTLQGQARVVFALAAICALFAFDGSAAAADAGCPNEDRRTGAAAKLPECRAYELVSPVDKGVGEVGLNLNFAPSVAGDKFVFQSFQAFGDAVSAGAVTDYLATRSASGWTTHAISPPVPSDFQASSYYIDFDASLGKGILNAWPARAPVEPLTPDTPPGRSNKWYVGELASDRYELLSTAVPAFTFPPSSWFALGGTSADFTHVSFSAGEGAKLLPEAPGTRDVYEWVDGELRLASILPPDTCGVPPCIAPEADVAGGGAVGLEVNDRSMSEDGSRVFFVAEGNLYVREDGTTTTQVGGPGAIFVSASKQTGSKVLYLDGACGLCVVDLETDETTKIDEDAEPADGITEVAGVVDVSDDLSRIYFGALGRLTAGEGAEGPLAGTANMYRWQAGELSFIGYFDEPGTGDFNNLFHAQGLNLWGGLIARSRATDLTPDGSLLLFSSLSQPTGYDNSNPNCQSAQDSRCAEVYLYDAEADGGAGRLDCLTCQPGGASSDSRLMGSKGTPQKIRQTSISRDGRIAFFESEEALVPTDGNGRLDVYAYEIESGRLSLISTGTSTSDSRYGGMSSDGSTAFIVTRERLLPADVDDASDAYAVRVGGGFPPPPPPPPPECLGEDCQGEGKPAPAPALPASGAIAGPGNPPAKRAKGKRQCKGKGAKGKGKQGRRAGAKRSAARGKSKPRCRGAKSGSRKGGQRR